ncbi:MAG: ZPR1 zinc finger domain-containing protein [Candidatus Woesearchaeota archaeon]
MATQEVTDNENLHILHGETCPICLQKTLTLVEEEREIPYFGNVFLFSMTCQNPSCGFHKSDIEAAQERDPCIIQFEVSGDDDLSVRLVKSANATVKIPRIVTIESDETAIGYISNIEGLFERVKKILESIRDNSDSPDEVKKAKNHLKKIQRILWGKDKITITIEDPSGNSAIISEKAVVKKLPKQKSAKKKK